eukprot:CAMPEP_0178425694 /NCGR_PEP_ID=MMETSP0689_2-20121128/28853_1 /TAXON_ID=160604 /ORGANISM="Amphidinium massartii, Strain CS-259" /LENGTH=781 /DNA_ID=CAMNT_0020047361 /DNA_START=1 /DNA_END=2346 /DNA_ORIENTATION=-
MKMVVYQALLLLLSSSACILGAQAAPVAQSSWRSLLPLSQSEEQQQQQQSRRLTASASGFKLAESFGGLPGFHHGVASGDPLKDAVVIWTRYTPVTADEVVEVEFRIAPFPPARDANEEDLANVLTLGNPGRIAGRVMASNSSDWIVKVDVGGLRPGTDYVYGFAVVGSSEDSVSVVGTTKTAPEGHVETLRYALFSCAHWTFGYFHPYDLAATIKDLDFWVHVGDYIYEKGDNSGYNGDVRVGWEPAWETETLQDYRLRYAQYTTDEALQALRRRAPLVAVWDDHEFTNNNWATNAENHDGDDASYIVRARAAAQAYVEWLPIRRSLSVGGILEDFSITQVIEWGDLATLVGLDTRIAVRSEAPTLGEHADSSINLLSHEFASIAKANTNVSSYTEEPLKSAFEAAAHTLIEARKNTSFEMVGSVQRQLMEQAFSESKAAGKPWQIFAGATMMAPIVTPDFEAMVAIFPVLRAVLDYVYSLSVDSGFEPVENEMLSVGEYMRIISAAATFSVPWNTDDFNGFAHERQLLLDMFDRSTNNAVVLGGDLHDSYAWTIYENATVQAGRPVTVNIGTPSVTSPGNGDALYSIFSALGSIAWDLINTATHIANPGLKYVWGKDRGFVSMTVTHQEHVAEFINMNDAQDSSVANAYAAMPYDVARNASENPFAAPFFCGKSMSTAASQRGSLEPREGACLTKFDYMRPLAWQVVVNLPASSAEPSSTTPALGNATTATEASTSISDSTTTVSGETTSVVDSAEMLSPARTVLLAILGALLLLNRVL